MAQKNFDQSQYSEIFKEIFKVHINSLKRCIEINLEYPFSQDYEIFQYADQDYYFYNDYIRLLERDNDQVLDDVIFKLLISFKIPFKHLNKKNKMNPFSFIIPENERNIGYMFSLDFVDEEVNSILRKYRIDRGYIIRLWHKSKSLKWIKMENDNYKKLRLRVRAITLEDFFNKYFNLNVYNDFLKEIEDFLQKVKEIIGYKSIKLLSYMNLSDHIKKVEKVLTEFPYKSYKYQIIDEKNEQVKKYLSCLGNTISDELISSIQSNYLTEKLYKTMVGKNEYAESFITSEWLFDSLNGKNNFDFTSVTSGYLKSIEQLLYMIVMINVDNNCKITISGDSKIRKLAEKAGVTAYKEKNHNWEKLDKIAGKNPYIDLVSEQVEYMDNSIGAFEFFLKYNPHIFIDQNLASIITGMIGAFRTECRNGYFHKHNLNDWSKVKIIRSNAIYLYFFLLGACIIPKKQKEKLGIMEFDAFDELCVKIREFKNYNIRYILINKDGSEQKLIYDFHNNTKEFNGRIEHYDQLLFYKVDDFSTETLEKMDLGINDNQIFYLTRDNLPHKIFGVYRNKSLEELYSDI